MPDYKMMYFQLAAKVADAMDILLKAQQEGEAEFMDGESFPGLKVMTIQDENRDSEQGKRIWTASPRILAGKEAFKAHGSSTYFQEAAQNFEDLLEGKIQVKFLEEV